jgi:hypothetical protein
MRNLTALLVLALVIGAATAAGAAEPGFADVICPQATQYVLAVGKLRNSDPPERIYAAAQAATDAYQRCSKDKLSNGFREAQHYADTRGSSFAVLAARALVALKRPDDARRELEQWRPLVQQVVDWKSETETIVSPHSPLIAHGDMSDVMAPPEMTAKGGDHRASMYAKSAKEIVVAIDAELAQIPSERERPRTQGRSSPEPAPSASPKP